jgi:type IX secretion system PorP/SprF family membrane protein
MKNAFLKYLVTVVIIFLIKNNCNGQDIHFSQFTETPILRNPALAGIFSGDLRIQAVYRNQWNSVTTPYQTSSINAEYKLPVGQGDDFLTLGGAILYDKAGTIALTATHVLPVLNFHKSLSAEKNRYLSAGFAAGIVQRSLDWSKMTTNNQYNGTNFDPTLSAGESFLNNNYLYFDGSAGLSFNTQIGENPDNNIFLGAAYHHFNKSASVSFFNSPDVQLIPKLVFSAGVRMSVNDFAYVTFNGDYSKQGTSSEMIGGMLYSLKLDDPTDPHYVISGGGFLRWKDAFIPIIKIEVSPLAFAVSYDVNVSTLKAASQSRGGFELSISYQKFVNRDNSSREAVRCPRF